LKNSLLTRPRRADLRVFPEGTSLAPVNDMDIEDGFILGVYNYCDRWCEACALTSRCRLFADCAEAEATLDPALSAVVSAPPLRHDVSPTPRWMQELIDELNEASSRPIPPEELARLDPPVAAEHADIEERAHGYLTGVHLWLRSRDVPARGDPGDPLQVIAWFHTMISAKIHRALKGLAWHELGDRDDVRDYDGSAKVALLGIERSHAAWLRLVEQGQESEAEARPHVAHLVWLGQRLETVFPNARSFVRPGFDEPDALARLLATPDE